MHLLTTKIPTRHGVAKTTPSAVKLACCVLERLPSLSDRLKRSTLEIQFERVRAGLEIQTC